DVNGRSAPRIVDVLDSEDRYSCRMSFENPSAERIGRGLAQDIAISEQKRITAREVASSSRGRPGTIDGLLEAELDRQAPLFEVPLNSFAPVAGHDQEFLDTRSGQRIEDVFQQRASADREHWLRNLGGHLAHSRAAARGQDNRLMHG